ncbi:hydrolase [Cellulomonas chitinilytica]|uniref:Hydrolase n=1 Tax=Cellulomonas chitinilytica TaxID=398759 RepID=A0A919P138_9CELL|nr:alpha/beta fold hydrolase [Cellulomonas chitinilytica]GIG20207.1 hydrolase [Cellulomonas chitinilytica]
MTQLHHECAGHGPVVVLLHSGVTDLRQWDPQWQALAEHHRVVRYDRRGWGRSPLPEASAPPYCSADDLMALLDELDIDRAALVGSSAGGAIAQQVASTWPERVSHLVLLCTDGDAVEPTSSVRAFGRREDELLEAGDVAAAVELNVSTFLGPDASAGTRDQVRRMQRNAFDVQLAAGDDVPCTPGPPIDLTRATMPATVVSGSLDLDYFTLTADAIAQQLPGARRTVLPWAGHLPNLERPDDVTTLLLDALA